MSLISLVVKSKDAKILTMCMPFITVSTDESEESR